MGEFVYYLVCPGRSREQVQAGLDGLEDRVRQESRLNPEMFGWTSSDRGVLLLPGDCQPFGALLQGLSQALEGPVLLAHIYDGDLWGYTLYRRGEELDDFLTCPDYFEEDAGENQPPVSWRARLLREVFPWASPDLESYLPFWTEEEREGEGAPACPAARRPRGDPWEAEDFLTALGFPPPEAPPWTSPARAPEKSSEPDPRKIAGCTRLVLETWGRLEQREGIALPAAFLRICRDGGMNWLAGPDGTADEAGQYFMEPALRPGWYPIGPLEAEHWHTQMLRQMWAAGRCLKQEVRFVPLGRVPPDGFALLLWPGPRTEPRVVLWREDGRLSPLCPSFGRFFAAQLARAVRADPSVEGTETFRRHLDWLEDGPPRPADAQAMEAASVQVLEEFWDVPDPAACLTHLKRAAARPAPPRGLLARWRGEPPRVRTLPLPGDRAELDALLERFYAGELERLELEFSLPGEGTYVRRLKKTVYQPYALILELARRGGKTACLLMDDRNSSLEWLIYNQKAYFETDMRQLAPAAVAELETKEYLTHPGPELLRRELPFLLGWLERHEEVCSPTARQGVWSRESYFGGPALYRQRRDRLRLKEHSED